jgi:hypothetical protein
MIDNLWLSLSETFSRALVQMLLVVICPWIFVGCSQGQVGEGPTKGQKAEETPSKKDYDAYKARFEVVFAACSKLCSAINENRDISYDEYSKRRREMDLVWREFSKGLSQEEEQFPSARLIAAFWGSHLMAEEVWNPSSKKGLIGGVECDYSLWHQELVKDRWNKASAILVKAAWCIKKSDSIKEEKCTLCNGTGKWLCAACNGSGKCSTCTRGTGKMEPLATCRCNGTGICGLCKGKGTAGGCRMCGGEGLFPRSSPPHAQKHP